mmetsp:Transcript_8239/g.11992  ORF Transcript_8239/g.11992 Transcript_8239/m.11992 type:complete len:102 (-) Transcript_8239:300-605(-)
MLGLTKITMDTKIMIKKEGVGRICVSLYDSSLAGLQGGKSFLAQGIINLTYDTGLDPWSSPPPLQNILSKQYLSSNQYPTSLPTYLFASTYKEFCYEDSSP